MPTVRGSVTHYNVELSVGVDECLRVLKEEAWARLGRCPPSNRSGYAYINLDSKNWEVWTNTHGSGYTEGMEPATDSELELNQLFLDLENSLKGDKKDLVSVNAVPLQRAT